MSAGKTSGSVSLIVDICNVLDISPNYLFDNVINNNNKAVEVLSSDLSSAYLKLNSDNQNFVNKTIEHLYNMQKKS